MATEQEFRGYIAGIRKTAKQLGFYGPVCKEVRLEMEAIADRLEREGLTELNAEDLDDMLSASTAT